MLLISVALASSPPAPDVYAWPTEADGTRQLVVALTDAVVAPGLTYVVDIGDDNHHVELACTRERAGGVVCTLDDEVFRTDWGATSRTNRIDLFAGERADPSPADTSRVVKSRRAREQPDPAESVRVRAVQAIVVGIPLDRLGPVGPTSIRARVVRRTWRAEVPR